MVLSQIFTIGAGVLSLATVASYLAPKQVYVERSQIIKATPADIIALASSNQGYQAFNPYKFTDSNLEINHFGPETGVGSGFEFKGKEGKGKQTVAAVSDTKVVYHIDLGAMGKPTQTIEVEEVAEGSKVTWSMDADMGMNPIARVMGLFMDGMVGKTFTSGLKHLAAATAA